MSANVNKENNNFLKFCGFETFRNTNNIEYAKVKAATANNPPKKSSIKPSGLGDPKTKNCKSSKSDKVKININNFPFIISTLEVSVVKRANFFVSMTA